MQSLYCTAPTQCSKLTCLLSKGSSYNVVFVKKHFWSSSTVSLNSLVGALYIIENISFKTPKATKVRYKTFALKQLIQVNYTDAAMQVKCQG